MRALIAWLNQRFPQQVVLTMQDYKELREEIGQLNVAAQQLQELHQRLSKVESNLSQLNVMNGFVNPTGKGLGGRLER